MFISYSFSLVCVPLSELIVSKIYISICTQNDKTQNLIYNDIFTRKYLTVLLFIPLVVITIGPRKLIDDLLSKRDFHYEKGFCTKYRRLKNRGRRRDGRIVQRLAFL